VSHLISRMRLRLAAGLLLVALACAAAPAGASQPGNPFAGAPWYVDAQTKPALAEQALRDAGQRDDADRIDVISRTPTAKWYIASNPADSRWVQGYFSRADAWNPNGLVVLALHGLPHQVCAGENPAGASDASSYRAWVDGYARALANRRSVVVLEPDALAAASCLSKADRAERYALIAYAARTLSALPHTGVYIDAGAGDWLNVNEAARRLRAAGVRYARGFALNSTHFDWTSAEVSYGAKLGRMLGGKHFVVNTAFNGRGPKLRGRYYHEWCNPSGRALGPLPTLRTGNRLADAFYWLNTPGESDGHCNGGPSVGTFWLPWGLELVANSAGAPDFPVYRHGR
jgi:endoglucanase